ncbi:glucose-1-phosphate cytidylyltransferase [Paenalkalicoccus suaedae]|uniref:Glucose-1-phosphate cytidylyltransferase n=1 Tax=Paenalkalicoccus suaedae TaxID=2592382 RepID=A0A859FAL2_9BACI|nr:glucose-1-phosphate cytidylyltransferase [Paenalkalicoccus suaedae]QKS70363.1 glucose-1-phosphate cytidylyltransferase [Paenalkalicoccus suaedae]
MKVVILAGGFGTRFAEATSRIPKPMIEIGGKPILWHIMKHYSSYGFNEFIICLGYKAHVIKEYFLQYAYSTPSITVNMTEAHPTITVLDKRVEPWKITLLDTGDQAMTGGRLKKAVDYVEEDTFLATYGDGLSNVNIPQLLSYHQSHGKLATLTAVQPEGRFGSLAISPDNTITSFEEKPLGDHHWINGGFFVLNKHIFDAVQDEQTIFESDILPELAKNHELMSFKHTGFWKPMDMLKDQQALEAIWNKGHAPWKTWG